MRTSKLTFALPNKVHDPHQPLDVRLLPRLHLLEHRRSYFLDPSGRPGHFADDEVAVPHDTSFGFDESGTVSKPRVR